MNIDAIRNGIVIDHIRSGGAMELYRLLHLDKLDCTVAIIKNAPSELMGRKDIIKINVIRDGRLVEKRKLTMPERIVNVLRCKNPRCITSVEPDLPQIFKLTSPETHTYRCIYCETKAEANQ